MENVLAQSSAAAFQGQIVSPGDLITEDGGFLRGHGTLERDGALYSAVAGVVERVNKLVSVRPYQHRYVPEVGDVVVARVTEVGQKRWKVDIGARQDAVLQLSAVNLPGGTLRRRTYEDQLHMRSFLGECDLLSAEVQAIHHDGAVMLHTRSLKYGKLGYGELVRAPPSLIKRSNRHFATLSCGVGVIMGVNGYIWCADPAIAEAERHAWHNEEPAQSHHVALSMREKITRVRNAILALAEEYTAIYEKTIMMVYDDSLQFDVALPDMRRPDVIESITERAKQEA